MVFYFCSKFIDKNIMKKLFLSIVASFLFNTVNAQGAGDIEIGIGAGVNVSSVSNLYYSADSRISFNLGATGDYYFSDRWSLKARLIFDQKGWANGFVNNQDTGSTVISDFKVNYLTVPVMANWHFGSSRNWYLNFGPYVGFLVSVNDSKLGLDLKEAFVGKDFGLAYGIGYKFKLNNMNLFVEYESQGGFSDIFKDNNGGAFMNRRSSFNLGVLFPL